MSRQGARAATVVALIALGVAGCGGDGGPDAGAFVARANTVCKRHYVKISAAASRLLAGGKLPGPREFGVLANGTIIPEYRAQLTELRKLEPSGDKATAYRAWLDASDALKGRLVSNPALIQDAGQLAAVNAESDRLGLASECHIGPGG